MGEYAILVNELAPAQVIDLADPTNPILIGTFPFPAGTGAHNAYSDGQYVYIVGGAATGGLQIYDLQDPANPALVGEFQPHYYHDVYVRNDTASAAAIHGPGVDIIDLSDKTQPRLITRFDYPNSGAHNCWTSKDGRYLFVGDEIGAQPHTRVFDLSDLTDVEKVADIIVDADGTAHNSYVNGNLLYFGPLQRGRSALGYLRSDRPKRGGVLR